MDLKDPIFKPLMFSGHMVPGIWQYMLPQELLSMEAPAEKRASCMDCPNIFKENYRKDYRCCTYHPAVTNFALGFALQTDLGKGPVTRLIENGHCMPEGSVQTPKEWIDYLVVNKDETFGKCETVLCHLLDHDTGYCSVYAFRNSVCSTFFCLHDHGDQGQKFWNGVQELSGQVESALAQWALKKIGFNIDAYIDRMNQLGADSIESASNPNRGWTKSARQMILAEWYGKEVELYTKCAEVIFEHRHDLWDIANDPKNEIREAHIFDKHQIAQVPERLHTELDEEDYEEGEGIPPYKIWRSLQSTERTMWKLPDQRLVLSPRADICDNPKDDDESKHHKKSKFALDFLARKNGSTYDWRIFLEPKEVKLLEEFRKGRKVTPQFLKKMSLMKIKNPEQRIAEWFRKKSSH